jgi:hypothetical protein
MNHFMNHKMTSYRLIDQACQENVPHDLLDIIYGYFCDSNLNLYDFFMGAITNDLKIVKMNVNLNFTKWALNFAIAFDADGSIIQWLSDLYGKDALKTLVDSANAMAHIPAQTVFAILEQKELDSGLFEVYQDLMKRKQYRAIQYLQGSYPQIDQYLITTFVSDINDTYDLNCCFSLMMLDQSRIKQNYQYLDANIKEKLDLLTDNTKNIDDIPSIYIQLLRIIMCERWKGGYCSFRNTLGYCPNRVVNMALYCQQCQELIVQYNQQEFKNYRGSSYGFNYHTQESWDQRPRYYIQPGFGNHNPKYKITDLRSHDCKQIQISGQYGSTLIFNPTPQPYYYTCQQYPNVVCRLNDNQLIIWGKLVNGMMEPLTSNDRSVLPKLLNLECY